MFYNKRVQINNVVAAPLILHAHTTKNRKLAMPKKKTKSGK